MAFDINNPYLRTKVLTASPEELRLMLIDGCIHFLRLGRDGIAERDYEKSFENLQQAKAIIMEMLNGLRPQHAPELCNNLTGLYTFMLTHLTHASFDKDPEKVNEVIRLMEYERETWTLLMDKLAKERAQNATATTPSTTPSHAANAGVYSSGAKPPARQPISIQG